MISQNSAYLQALQKGSKNDLRKIYQEFLPRIKKMVVARGGGGEDAKDVFQDALIIIYEKAKAGEIKGNSSFYTLLYGVSLNVWRNRLRKSSKKEVTISEEETQSVMPDIEQRIQEEEEGKLFYTAFKKLGEDCQKVLRYFFDDKKMQEIMDLMEYSSLSYTKKRKFQCKEQLVKYIKADERFLELKV